MNKENDIQTTPSPAATQRGLELASAHGSPAAVIGFDEECIWHFALRYALPRTSTASIIVSEWLTLNLPRLRMECLPRMKHEIDYAIEHGAAGDLCDVVLWRKLSDDMGKRIESQAND